MADDPSSEFAIDPEVFKEVIDNGWFLRGTYHSHPEGPSHPSDLDQHCYRAVSDQFPQLMSHLVVSFPTGQPYITVEQHLGDGKGGWQSWTGVELIIR